MTLFFQLLILGVVFAFVTMGVYWWLNRGLNSRLENRLSAIRSEALDEEHMLVSRSEVWAREWLGRLVRFSMDKEKWEDSPVRLRFFHAGYRGDLIILVYFGGKTLLTLLLPLVYLVFSYLTNHQISIEQRAVIALGLAASGYYFPNLVLNWRIQSRQRELFESFPDALDLIRVCVNAGLGLDAAIARVGHELRINSRELADEFRLLSLELRAGASRTQALRNLGMRTGLEDIKALVTMLIQAERFGTSVGDSLRVHAEALRSKRQFRAQEQAGMIPVKMTIPMVFCILPALFVVVIGPAILKLIHTLNNSL